MAEMTPEWIAELRVADIKELLTNLFIELHETRDALARAQQEIAGLKQQLADAKVNEHAAALIRAALSVGGAESI